MECIHNEKNQEIRKIAHGDSNRRKYNVNQRNGQRTRRDARIFRSSVARYPKKKYDPIGLSEYNPQTSSTDTTKEALLWIGEWKTV